MDTRDRDSAWKEASTDDVRSTDSLEAELKEISERIATDPQRFQQVREELARRRRVKDEQPPMTVITAESQHQAALDLERNLILKVTAMEAQQAQLVVETEIAKHAQHQAEERLALLVKTGVCVPASVLVEVMAALRDVPSGGASGDAAPWIQRLHRAASAVIDRSK